MKADAAWAVGVTTLALALAGCGPAASVEPAPRPAASVDTLTSLPPRTEVPLLVGEDYAYLRATINGRDAGLFMLDTGSTLAVIDPGVAGRLGLSVLEQGTSLGIAGREAFTYRGVDYLALDGVTLNLQRLAGLDVRRFHRTGRPGINGLLGLPAFGRAPVTIDQPAGVLTVYQPGSFTPPASPPHRLLSLSGLPMVEAEVGRGRRILLVLDSGANNHLTLPTEALRRWPDILAVSATGSARSRGVGGLVQSTRGWVGRLGVLGMELEDVPTAFEPASPTFRRGGQIIGRVGNELLRQWRVTIDPARRRVWAEAAAASR